MANTTKTAQFGHKPSIKRLTLCLMIAFLFCLLAATNATIAATYYLDPSGSDDANGLSVGTAWRTLSKAQVTVTSGDTVIVRNGSYGTYSENGVSRTNWVTYRAATGHVPELTQIKIDNQDRYNTYLVFDGFVIRPTTAIGDAIEIRNSKYAKFLNLNVVGQGARYTTRGFNAWQNCSDVTIDHCIFSGGEKMGRFDGFGYGISATETDNLAITNNEIKQIRYYGVYVSCLNVTVSNNNIHNLGGDGIFIGGGNGPLLIEKNEIHDLYLYTPELTENPTGTTWSADGKTMTNPNATWGVNAPYSWIGSIEIRIRSGSNVKTGDPETGIATIVSPTEIVLNKSIKLDPNGATPSNVDYYFIDKTHGDLIQAGAGGIMSNLTIRGNKCYDCYGQVWWINPYVAAEPNGMGGRNFLIENNLCWNLEANAIEETAHNALIGHVNGLTVRNNTVIGRLTIGYDSTDGHCYDVNLYGNITAYIRITPTVTNTRINYNIFNRGSIQGVNSQGKYDIFLNPGESESKWKDPQFTGIFTDYANGDFRHASATSLGVGHGDPANYPLSDILGHSRGSSPDAGCYEYVGSQSSNNPPNADAGQDQTVIDSDQSGSEQVTLNGSGSSGNIADSNYVWTWTTKDGNKSATGVKPTVSLPVGRYTITLKVTDNSGLTDTDTVIVTVESPSAGDNVPPSILDVTATDRSIEVTFSETLDEASATNTANYSLNNGLTIDSIWPEILLNRVTLYTNSLHQDGMTYALTVTNVKDAAGNPMPQTTRSYTYTLGLVGQWVFDNTGGSSVTDVSGHSNTGTLLNGAQVTANGEATLVGGNDAVQIATTGLNAGQGTIALWAYQTNPSGNQSLFGHTIGSSNRIQLYLNAGSLCVGLGNSNSTKTNVQLLTPQTWYHIALSWDGTNYAVYVDGIEKATGTYAGLTQLNTLADFGNTGNASSRNQGFNGLIDESRVYSRSLTAAEINDLALAFLPIGDKTVAEGSQLNFSIRTKPGVTVALSNQNLPSSCSFAPNTFAWTPNYNHAGTYEVEFTAQHGASTDFEKITVTVTDTQQEEPVGYWKFNELDGDIASDSSTTGNTGYLQNGLVWGQGKHNGAIMFSVPNDAVEIQTTKLNPQYGTIAMWVYMDKQTLSRHYLFGHASSTQTNRIQLYLKYGNLCLGLGNSHETRMDIQQLQNQRWYHIALTWSEGAYNVYVDGMSMATGTYSGLTGLADHADIGNNGVTRNKGLTGSIDDVMIYNRALNALEIISLATN